MAVIINSGPIEPLDSLREVPRDQWHSLPALAICHVDAREL
jgi:hypothetical protein